MRNATIGVLAISICLLYDATNAEPVTGVLPSQQDEQKSSVGVLVTPEWVERHQNDANVMLLGLGQKKDQYALAHIPGEFFVDWRTEITDPDHPDRFNLPPKKQVEKLLGRLGVSPHTTIVLSDNLSSRLSTRVFWTLRSYGHRDVKILDGGRKAWVQSGRDFTRVVPKTKPTKYVIKTRDKSNYANLAEVKKHLERDNSVLIDGRPSKQYTGEDHGKAYHNAKKHKRKGHIVNARNIIWSQNFNKDGTFKSPAELKKLYEQAGVTRDKDVVTYCNEGLHAAPPWFVLTELLGYKNVQLYDDSMAEWANRDDTPMTNSFKKK